MPSPSNNTLRYHPPSSQFPQQTAAAAMEGGSRALLGQVGEDEQSRNVVVMGAGALTVARDYMRGNWTLPETMLLIEAKRKVHEERHPGDQGLARWRWVEDYCWRAGCRRSHNQCNDRWDNLMRDYKKVRAYEMATTTGVAVGRAPSYWAMGRSERKEKGLPSNLLREIYDAMSEVIERRMSMGGAGGGGASSSLLDVPMQASPLAQVLPRPLPLLEQETRRHQGQGAAHFSSESSPERKRRRPSVDELLRPGTGSSTPPSPGTRIHLQVQGHHHHHHHSREQGHQHHHRDDDADHGGEEGESSGGSECSDDDEDGGVLSGAIGQCAAILSGALESREAAEERRHREVMAVEERRGRARQARRDAGEQCVAGLASAVNQLAGSMLALAAAKRKGKGPAAPK